MPKNTWISSINSSCWVIWLEATNVAQIKQLSRWIYSFPLHLKVGVAYIIIWDLTINAFQTSANLLQQPLLHWEPAAERATSAQAFSSPRRILTVGQQVDQKTWNKSNTTSHVIWSSAGNMLSLNAREASRNPKNKVRCWMTQAIQEFAGLRRRLASKPFRMPHGSWRSIARFHP